MEENDFDFSKVYKILSEEITNFPVFDYEDILTENLPRTRKDLLEEEFFRNRLGCVQGWFIRLSLRKKVEMLTRLASCVSNFYTIIHVLNTIYTATCKDWIYSAYQGLHLLKNDKMLNDTNRTLDEDILEKVIKELVTFFQCLNDTDQYSLLSDMLLLSDSCIIGLAFSELLIVLKSKLRAKLQKILEQEALSAATEVNINKKGKKEGKVKKAKSDIKDKKERKNKKGKKDDKSLTQEDIEKQKQLELEKIEREQQLELEQIEKQKQKEIEDIYNFLNEKFPHDSIFSMPAKLNEMLNNWNLFISNFNKKVGLTIEQKPKQGKKSKGKKKDKISKDLPDQIQLLPIWINKRIIASMDAKALKNAKKVNKYWNFIVKGVTQDIKCRQELNKSCAKLKNNLQICDFEKVNTDLELKPKYCHITDTTNPDFRERVEDIYNAQTTFTLMSDLYKHCTRFNVCGTKLDSFPRFTYAYLLDFETLSVASKESTKKK